eukprot:scaffold189944_cov28-Tisochrysis_lutea.AAC.2
MPMRKFTSWRGNGANRASEKYERKDRANCDTGTTAWLPTMAKGRLARSADYGLPRRPHA